ncbi:hypothetical protein BGP77_02510 [Saccharospirillum sp. MSK14-1]|uniref:RDD family protein n=1 Tax=Saccharospirillum sp. MSK14-1 TaxID=1897632 RepID=UPI000D367DE1|nr:RDD family protein [Saccharospirillum sp. MSK14-1]PTY36203.1 hypothetical protein BGP77_02510 [Saccharospirillum sp. MSK14-1]
MGAVLDDLQGKKMAGLKTETVVFEWFAAPWKRYLAGLIDWLFLGAIWIMLYLILIGLLYSLWPIMLSRYFYLLVIAVLYLGFTAFKIGGHLAFGATPGKWVLGLSVVYSSGEPVLFWGIVRRYLVELVIVAVAVILMGYLYWQQWQLEAASASYQSVEVLMQNAQNVENNRTIQTLMQRIPTLWLMINSVLLGMHRRYLSVRDRIANTVVIDRRKMKKAKAGENP